MMPKNTPCTDWDVPVPDQARILVRRFGDTIALRQHDDESPDEDNKIVVHRNFLRLLISALEDIAEEDSVA